MNACNERMQMSAFNERMQMSARNERAAPGFDARVTEQAG
jgi:hypothetical protein